MPLKRSREEAREAAQPKLLSAALLKKIEALHDELEAAGARRQVLDHLQEAYFAAGPEAEAASPLSAKMAT